MKSSPCGRFVVLDGLHLDRKVFKALERWAEERGLGIQDAIQLALCALSDGAFTRGSVPAVPPSSARVLARTPTVGRID